MVQHASRPMPGKEQGNAGCRHYWIIEAPTGPVSRGVCRVCHVGREFKNYIEAVPWGDDPPVAQPNNLYRLAPAVETAEEAEEF